MVQNRGSLGPVTVTAVGSIPGVRGRNIVFKVVTSGAETISVTGEVTPTNISGQIMFKSLLTGALHSGVAMDDGTYFMENIPVDTLVFLGSAAVDTKTVFYAVWD